MLRSFFAMAAFVIAAALAGNQASAEPRNFKLDPEHLTISFLVQHIGFAKTLGVFRQASGSVVFDEARSALKSIDVSVKAASVDSGHKARDKHVRGKDFLHAGKHPTIRFVMTSAKKTSKRKGVITGNLTMRGQTHPVKLNVTWNKSGKYPFGKKQYVVGVSARGTIKRSKWGSTYAVANGVVGDKVELIIEAELIRQD